MISLAVGTRSVALLVVEDELLDPWTGAGSTAASLEMPCLYRSGFGLVYSLLILLSLVSSDQVVLYKNF